MAEQMQVEDDDGAELLGALLQEGVVGPQTREAAREASKVYELLLVTGVSRGDAVAKVSELCSPPRVTAELGRLPVMSLVGGSCFDLRGDANGVAWDFTKAAHRERARERVRREKPFLVIGSPPCTEFSVVQNMNRHHFSAAEARRRRAEAMTLLGFALEIYQMQLSAGRHFLHEHPASASSWREAKVQRLRQDPRVAEVVGHQCRYGLRTRGPDGAWMPALKPTRFLSSSEAILEQLGLRRRGTHRHQQLLGSGRASAAAIYPPWPV